MLASLLNNVQRLDKDALVMGILADKRTFAI